MQKQSKKTRVSPIPPQTRRYPPTFTTQLTPILYSPKGGGLCHPFVPHFIFPRGGWIFAPLFLYLIFSPSTVSFHFSLYLLGLSALWSIVSWRTQLRPKKKSYICATFWGFLLGIDLICRFFNYVTFIPCDFKLI